MNRLQKAILKAGGVLTATSLTISTFAQPTPPPRERGPQGPRVSSPEISPDRHVTFRIHAPNADKVRLTAGDIPIKVLRTEMTKATNGVWELTVGPIDPGAYRYSFNLDGV